MEESTKLALTQQLEGLRAAKAAGEKNLAPLKKQRDDLREQIGKLEADLRQLDDAYKQGVKDARLYELDQDIAQVARALGARSIRARGL